MQKTNMRMLILSAIGIVMVVLGHTGNSFGVTSEVFPFGSFHMVLFIFISGYFYKVENENNLIGKGGYIRKKIKKLVIPYFVWNLFYGVIGQILRENKIISFGDNISLFTFFCKPWDTGHQYIFNLAAWFILALFLVNVVYVIIRKLMTKFKIWDDKVMLVIFFWLALQALVIKQGITSNIGIPITRTMFFIAFYHFGYYYKNELEKKIKINNFLFIIACIIIEILLKKIGGNISYNAFIMTFKTNNYIIIILASLNGIMFWAKISEILEPVLKKSKVINFIGNNTLSIMIHHLFWIFIFNKILLKITNVFNIQGFNYQEFIKNIYYRFMGNKYAIFYFIVAITCPLILKKLYDIFTSILIEKYHLIKKKYKKC